jgi:hypothetical protein
MQLEGHQALANGAGSAWPFDYQTVFQDATRTQVLTLILAEEPAVPGGTPQSFVVTPQLFPLPANHLMLWRELGRWICGFTRENELAHFQVLSGRDLDEDLLVEIRCIRGMLEANEFIGKLEGMRIWDGGAKISQAAFLGNGLGLPAQIVARPEPSPPKRGLRLLPESVARKRVARKRRSRSSRWLVAGAAIYLLAMGFFVTDLFRRERQNGETSQWLAEHEPEAARVRESRRLWVQMEPAVNVDRYPLEVFHRLVSLLPEEGIRLTHFEVDLDSIAIRGEASSSDEAITWKNRLLNTTAPGDSFAGFEWSFPQPEILPDNRATFSAEGVWKGGPVP